MKPSQRIKKKSYSTGKILWIFFQIIELRSEKIVERENLNSILRSKKEKMNLWRWQHCIGLQLDLLFEFGWNVDDEGSEKVKEFFLSNLLFKTKFVDQICWVPSFIDVLELKKNMKKKKLSKKLKKIMEKLLICI
jgi:hypothetical protein